MEKSFKKGDTYMLKKREAFLQILCLELDDLNEDISILIEECEKKHCNDEISNYVFLENLAVLKNELFGINSFLEDVKKTNSTDYDNLDSLIEGLMNILQKRINEKGIAHSIINLIDRKMKKVKIYVEE